MKKHYLKLVAAAVSFVGLMIFLVIWHQHGNLSQRAYAYTIAASGIAFYLVVLFIFLGARKKGNSPHNIVNR